MEYIIDFPDGSYVGKTSEYKTEQGFIAGLKNEYDIDTEIIGSSNIERRYVRWYSKPPYPLNEDFPDGCYSFCERGRGAFEVFV